MVIRPHRFFGCAGECRPVPRGGWQVLTSAWDTFIGQWLLEKIDGRIKTASSRFGKDMP